MTSLETTQPPTQDSLPPIEEDKACEQAEVSPITNDNQLTLKAHAFPSFLLNSAPNDLNLNHVAVNLADQDVQLPEPDFQWGEDGNTFCNLIS